MAKKAATGWGEDLATDMTNVLEAHGVRGLRTFGFLDSRGIKRGAISVNNGSSAYTFFFNAPSQENPKPHVVARKDERWLPLAEYRAKFPRKNPKAQKAQKDAWGN